MRATELRLPFPSVGATENIILAATAAEGGTIIHGAAREPEISALASYLRLLGSRITGDGTDTVTVEGPISEAHAEYRIIPDRIVASTLACAAAATGGDVELRGVDPTHFSTVLWFFPPSEKMVRTADTVPAIKSVIIQFLNAFSILQNRASASHSRADKNNQ